MFFTLEVILIVLTSFYLILSLWLFAGIKKLRKQDKSIDLQKILPKVSIIVAARNEEKNIQQCIEKCAAQDYPDDKVEVIVVNDRSDDSTATIIKKISEIHKNVRLINITKLPDEYVNSGKKHALKKGIENAVGEIFLLTDADCFPEAGWIKNMVQYFEHEVGVVVGHSPYNAKGFLNRLIQLDNLSIIAVGAGGIGGGYPILSVGRNFAYRRQVYDEIGGFDKIKDFSSGDDDLLLMLVRKHTNWKIGFASNPDSYVHTNPPQTAQEAIKQRMRWASKGLHYTIPMSLSLVAVFLYNLILFITIPLFFVNLFQSSWPIYSFIIKAIGDFIIIYQAGRLLNESRLVKYFPLAVLVHIPYLIFFGLYGTFGEVQWKTNDK
jgi:cellulose synthase/poly-beta-1,6-N-acetylglucosamine synthase-like glycosyltransferase